MARTFPPMMQVLKDVGGVEFPDTFANFTGNGHQPTAKNGSDLPIVKEKATTEVPGK
jgi:hypothetical protein